MKKTSIREILATMKTGVDTRAVEQQEGVVPLERSKAMLGQSRCSGFAGPKSGCSSFWGPKGLEGLKM